MLFTFRWIIGSWNLCNKKCGDGKQTRDVYCAQDVYNGTRYKVQDSNCSKHKPINEKSCNEHYVLSGMKAPDQR